MKQQKGNATEIPARAAMGFASLIQLSTVCRSCLFEAGSHPGLLTGSSLSWTSSSGKMHRGLAIFLPGFNSLYGNMSWFQLAHSGAEVNEQNNREKQLHIQKNKENQKRNTHGELKNLWSRFSLGHYFCCQRGHTLPKRDSSSATAESCFLLKLDKDSHHPKTLSDANNTNKVHSALHFQVCFQQFSSLLCVFIRASLPCNSIPNSR